MPSDQAGRRVVSSYWHYSRGRRTAYLCVHSCKLFLRLRERLPQLRGLGLRVFRLFQLLLEVRCLRLRLLGGLFCCFEGSLVGLCRILNG